MISNAKIMLNLEKITRHSCFPHPKTADPDGLLASSREMDTEMLLDAYAHGIFPWPVEEIPLMLWWSPPQRAIFELDDFHIPRRLRQTLRSERFRVTTDTDFASVIHACATIRREDGGGTWITPEIIRGFTRLHRMGVAHSVEVWEDARLVGGLYGVALGGFFAGESKFHRVTDASKVALAYTVAHLRNRGFTLFDVQMDNPHLQQFGLRLVSREEYLRRLAVALEKDCQFGKIEGNLQF